MEPLDHWIEAGRWPWTRVAMAELASRLPVDDAVLDGWLGEVVAKREEIAFRNLVFAGLGAGRPLCAKHLAEGTALFQDTDQLHRTAVRFTGNVGSALIAAVDTGRLEPDREAVAVAVAAMWCRERNEGQRIPGLMAAARRLGRRRRKSPATALALAVVCQVTEDPGLRSLMEGVSLSWVSGWFPHKRGAGRGQVG